MDSKVDNELEEGELVESTTEGQRIEDKNTLKQIDSETKSKQTTKTIKQRREIKPVVTGKTGVDPRAKKRRIPSAEEIKATNKRLEAAYYAKIREEEEMDPKQLLEDLIEKEEQSERTRVQLARAAYSKYGPKIPFDSPMGSPCSRRLEPLNWHGYDGGGEKGKSARREAAVKIWQEIQDRKASKAARKGK